MGAISNAPSNAIITYSDDAWSCWYYFSENTETQKRKGQKIAWKVLAVENGRALVLSEDILEVCFFDVTNDSSVYIGSDIQTYLKGDFVTAYGLSDVCIYNVDVTQGNGEYTIVGSGSDKVFLLSLSEAFSYFGQEENSSYFATSTFASYNGQTVWAWWSRTSACVYNDDPDDSNNVADIDIGSGEGKTSYGFRGAGFSGTEPCGLRPAFWVQIE